MLFKRFTDYILQSRLHAMGTAFIFAFIPLLGSISILIAALVTLRRGALEGFYILVASCLPLFISVYFAPDAGNAADTITNTEIIMVMVASNIATWLFAILLRKYASWNWLLQLAAFLCIVIVIGVHLANPDIQQWWQGRLTNFFTHSMQEMSSSSPDEVGAQKDTVSKIVSAAVPFATSFTAVFVMFYALLQLFLARWWQAAIFNPGGLRKELTSIRMSYAAGVFFIIAVALSFTGNAIIQDIMPIVYLTFVIAGFSIMHVLTSGRKASWLWNSLIYIGIIILPIGMLLIAVIALVDTFFDLRKRLPKKTNLTR